jgi:hypothetical protein
VGEVGLTPLLEEREAERVRCHLPLMMERDGVGEDLPLTRTLCDLSRRERWDSPLSWRRGRRSG